jgi:hypothetical protein
MLAGHHGLLAAPALTVVSALWQTGWLLTTKRIWISDLMAVPRSVNRIGWFDEIWPFQWRIAVSWLSGYFIFQLFNPVIFRYWGPVPAGRMGLSVSLTMGILTLGISWVNTKAPRFGVLIAQRRFEELDRLYFASLYRAIAIVVAANLLLLVGVVYFSVIGNKLSLRVLDPWPLACLMGASIVNVSIFAQALYLRAHKREPFLGLSVVTGLCTTATTFIFGKWYGSAGVAVSFFVVTLALSGGWASRIFQNCRKAWHSEAVPHLANPELVPAPET